MPLTKRAKYLLYLCLHIAFMFMWILVFDSYGARLQNKGEYYLCLLIATPFAVIGYLAINKLLDFYRAWQFRRGRDVYREEVYEDDAGFIHLNQKDARINKHELELIDLVKDGRTFVQAHLKDADE